MTISIFNGRHGIACSSTLLPSARPHEFKTRMRSGVANSDSAICQQRTRCPESSCRHIAMLKAIKGSHILALGPGYVYIQLHGPFGITHCFGRRVIVFVTASNTTASVSFHSTVLVLLLLLIHDAALKSKRQYCWQRHRHTQLKKCKDRIAHAELHWQDLQFQDCRQTLAMFSSEESLLFLDFGRLPLVNKELRNGSL